MQITIHGAGCREVTGSAYLVRTSAANVLVGERGPGEGFIGFWS